MSIPQPLTPDQPPLPCPDEPAPAPGDPIRARLRCLRTRWTRRRDPRSAMNTPHDATRDNHEERRLDELLTDGAPRQLGASQNSHTEDASFSSTRVYSTKPSDG